MLGLVLLCCAALFGVASVEVKDLFPGFLFSILWISLHGLSLLLFLLVPTLFFYIAFGQLNLWTKRFLSVSGGMLLLFLRLCSLKASQPVWKDSAQLAWLPSFSAPLLQVLYSILITMIFLGIAGGVLLRSHSKLQRNSRLALLGLGLVALLVVEFRWKQSLNETPALPPALSHRWVLFAEPQAAKSILSKVESLSGRNLVSFEYHPSSTSVAAQMLGVAVGLTGPDIPVRSDDLRIYSSKDVSETLRSSPFSLKGLNSETQTAPSKLVSQMDSEGDTCLLSPLRMSQQKWLLRSPLVFATWPSEALVVIFPILRCLDNLMDPHRRLQTELHRWAQGVQKMERDTLTWLWWPDGREESANLLLEELGSWSWQEKIQFTLIEVPKLPGEPGQVYFAPSDALKARSPLGEKQIHRVLLGLDFEKPQELWEQEWPLDLSKVEGSKQSLERQSILKSPRAIFCPWQRTLEGGFVTSGTLRILWNPNSEPSQEGSAFHAERVAKGQFSGAHSEEDCKKMSLARFQSLWEKETSLSDSTKLWRQWSVPKELGEK